MNVEQLEAFASVATLGGFTEASQQLHRSQPAISRRIAQLEKSLGVNLFYRRGKVTQLTENGTAFLRHVELALAELKDGVDLLTDSGQAVSTKLPLKVGVVGTLADQRLVSALQNLKQEHPGLVVTLRTATSREVSKMVFRGDLDVGIRYFEDNTKGLESALLGADELALISGSSGPYAGLSIRTPKDLLGVRILSFPVDMLLPDSFGAMLQRELLAFGVAEPDLDFVDSVTAQKCLVEAGYGIALLPISACRDELDKGTLVRTSVKRGALSASQPVYAVSRHASKRWVIGQFNKQIKESYGFS